MRLEDISIGNKFIYGGFFYEKLNDGGWLANICNVKILYSVYDINQYRGNGHVYPELINMFAFLDPELEIQAIH